MPNMDVVLGEEWGGCLMFRLGSMRDLCSLICVVLFVSSAVYTHVRVLCVCCWLCLCLLASLLC